MEWRTQIPVERAGFGLRHGDGVLLLGSCFADEMGRRLLRDKFRCLVNPFGTLYNPASIAAHLLRCVSEREYGAESPELVCDAASGRWLSWMHHGQFSARSRGELAGLLNERLREAARWLRAARVLVVTFGTAMVYRLRESDLLVANCHKQADGLFRRERLSAYDIVDMWRTALRVAWSVNPQLRVVLTVSPIRHRRDGLHANQLSKAELLLAADGLRADFPDEIAYFPSYELLLDELRDYRFYGDDLVHPSRLAADFIYERFEQAFVEEAERAVSRRCREVSAALEHRPFDAEGAAYEQFMRQTRSKVLRLAEEFPSLDFGEELAELGRRLGEAGAAD